MLQLYACAIILGFNYLFLKFGCHYKEYVLDKHASLSRIKTLTIQELSTYEHMPFHLLRYVISLWDFCFIDCVCVCSCVHVCACIYVEGRDQLWESFLGVIHFSFVDLVLSK